MFAKRRSLALSVLVLAVFFISQAGGVGLAQAPASSGSGGNSLASRLLEQHKPEVGRSARLRETLAKEPPSGAAPEELGRFYFNRSLVALSLGAVSQQISDLTKASEYATGILQVRALTELASANILAGSVSRGLSALENARAASGGQGPLIKLARIECEAYTRLGDLKAAELALERGVSLFELRKSRRNNVRSNFSLYENNWLAQLQRAQADIAIARGRWGEAEGLLRQALENQEKSAKTVDLQVRETGGGISEDMVLDGRDAILTKIADVQRAQGRAAEAELTLRESLAATLARVGRDAIVTARQCIVYAQLLADAGRPAEGEAFAREALAILERIGALPQAQQAAQARLVLAESLAARKAWKEALDCYAELMARVATAPGMAARLGRGNITWARALMETGQPGKAVDMLRQLAAEADERFGKDSYLPQELRGMLGVGLSRAGRKPEALAELRRVIPILLSTAPEEQLPAKRERRRLILTEAIALLADPAAKPGDGAASEAFLLADALHGSGTQQAVSSAAARGAAGSPELAALVRQEQDKRMEEDGLRRTLSEVLNLPLEQQSQSVIRGLKEQLTGLEAERKRLREALAKRFPAYAELLRPKAASLPQARAVLRPGECLLSILSTEQGSFIWAARREGQPAFAASPLTDARVSELVKRLRASLDPKDGDLDRAPAFDLAAAHELYKGLLLPVEAGLAGAENLLAVSGGALSQLPLGLLVTEPVQAAPTPGLPYAEFRDVPWLIRRAAITQLPSASVLIALRQARPGAAGRAAFLGLGDPEFGAAQPSLAQAASPALSRGIRLRNLPRQTRAADARALRESAVGVVGFADYAALPPLPDTREEILAIAGALGADPKSDVLLGREASVSALKAQDLTRRRILAFATHGLVPGDLPGLDQPALALASPGPGQTGLLTLEDILGLKLDADWVVLSACNTAAGDGAGADAVSGLGRAFFYAGGRSLLVTHWPVETVSARRLVTGVFSALGGGTVSRAEALRQSMLALMAAPGPKDASGRELYTYAHPIFWAPYALVGEDGAR